MAPFDVAEGKAPSAKIWPAGARVHGEFVCEDCGYGVVVVRALPSCPMCKAGNWRPVERF
jgi:rubrerythrin